MALPCNPWYAPPAQGVNEAKITARPSYVPRRRGCTGPEAS